MSDDDPKPVEPERRFAGRVTAERVPEHDLPREPPPKPLGHRIAAWFGRLNLWFTRNEP